MRDNDLQLEENAAGCQPGLSAACTPSESATSAVAVADTRPRRRGKGRLNAITHALRSAIGALPPGCGYVNRLAYAMRRQLETAVANVDGSISLTKAAWIDSAVKWERHGLLAGRWLRLQSGDMDLAQRLEFSREVARAADLRNKAIQSLGLDVDNRASIINQLYGPSRDSNAHDALGRVANGSNGSNHVQPQRNATAGFESPHDPEVRP